MPEIKLQKSLSILICRLGGFSRGILGLLFFLGEAAMKVVVSSCQFVIEMLEEIRQNHIDIEPIIEEELQEILPSFIEDIIRNVYNKIVRVK